MSLDFLSDFWSEGRNVSGSRPGRYIYIHKLYLISNLHSSLRKLISSRTRKKHRIKTKKQNKTGVQKNIKTYTVKLLQQNVVCFNVNVTLADSLSEVFKKSDSSPWTVPYCYLSKYKKLNSAMNVSLCPGVYLGTNERLVNPNKMLGVTTQWTNIPSKRKVMLLVTLCWVTCNRLFYAAYLVIPSKK